jgi:hypothetical protein
MHDQRGWPHETPQTRLRRARQRLDIMILLLAIIASIVLGILIQGMGIF